MQIDLPAADQQILAQQAIASGYGTVEEYVSTLLVQFAHQGPISMAALLASTRECEENYASIQRGGGREAKQAIQEIASELGLRVPE